MPPSPVVLAVFEWDTPSPLSSAHQSELTASGIHPELQRLNFYTLSDRDPYDHLLYSDDLSRRNDGRLTDHWLRLYNHLDAGGWWCAGLDPRTDWQPMEWGCFKPDNPRSDHSERAKIIKYEHPPKLPTRVFCLRVPASVWRFVAVRYGVSLPNGLDCHDPSQFWRWVSAHRLPIILCEGAKKAAALLSHGYVAIGLPGIFAGVRTVRDESGQVLERHLIPELQPFVDQGLSFTICFDYETKPHVLDHLRCSIRLLARLLLQQHCPVKLIHLPGPEKGVDDLLAHRSPAVFAACYRHATQLSLCQLASGLSLVVAAPVATSLFDQSAYRQLLGLTHNDAATAPRAVSYTHLTLPTNREV